MKKILQSKQIWNLILVFLTLVGVTIATPGLSVGGLNFIFSVQGNASVKRVDRSNYQPIYVGAFVSSTDRLRLSNDARVGVLCDNLQAWWVGSQGEFPISQGCGSSSGSNFRPGSKRAPTRSGSDPTIPYLLSPRDSAILIRQPMLRWNSVAGAESYKVRVLGPNVNWQTEVKQSQVVYGGASLKPDLRYWVSITASNGASNQQEEGRFRGFSVLSDTDNQKVNAAIARLKQQPLDDDARMFALAHLYRSNKLNADAIDVLEGLVKKGSQNGSVFHLLGNIYQDVGLNQLARERYLMGVKLATTQNNLELQAMTQASLGEVDVALYKLQDARQWYQSALKIYRQLEDAEKVKELQQNLDKLQGKE